MKHELTPEVISQIVDFAKKYEQKGDLVGIPREAISVMLQRQYEQQGEWYVRCFEKDRTHDDGLGGFDWEDTIEKWSFWSKTLIDKNFSDFFTRYPERFESEPQYRYSLGYPMSIIAQQKELFELMLTFVEDDFQKGLFIEKHISIIKKMEILEQKNQPEPVKQEENPTKPVYVTPCGTFTEGEEVETQSGKRIFYRYDERLSKPYLCVAEHHNEYFVNGDVFNIFQWISISKKPLPTIEEVANKAGISVEQLREVVKEGKLNLI